MSSGAEITLQHETDVSIEEVFKLADYVLGVEEIGAGPASGSFQTEGMLIVPCSMKTAAGIYSGYADNLILRAADVTIKEQRMEQIAELKAAVKKIASVIGEVCGNA